MNGFISLHRQFIDWEWYQDSNTKALFIHCLLMANWKDKRWQGKVIKRGSFVTSQEKLAQQLNLSRSAIRVAIGKLKKTGEIQTYGQLHTVVTICKYDSYQDIENNRSQSVANESPMNSQSVANESPLLNKEIKKQSNNKGRFTPPTYNEVYECFFEKSANEEYSQEQAERFVNFYGSKGWMVGKNKMQDWKKSAGNWHSRNKPKSNAPKKRTKEDEMAELRRMMG